MRNNGKKSLTNAELLAILIGSGNKNESAIELSQRILSQYENKLDLLSKAEVNQLVRQFDGIGEVKAITILAALELSRRLSFESCSQVETIKCSADIYEIIKPDLIGTTQEEAWVIYTNAACKIIQKKKLSQGGLNHCIIDTKIIIRDAINLLASGIVLIHNHPSGNTEPSEQDKKITKRLSEACDFCEITLLDHLIVSDIGYFSFHDTGFL